MAPPSAAMALRESFGDRKLPEISRRITACVSCRKLKIKCFMEKSKPPCSRCRAHGISCTVTKSLQMLLENDALWKEAMEQRMDQLEKTLMDSSELNSGFLASGADAVRPRSTINHRTTQTNRPRTVSIHQMPETSGTTSLNLSCSLGAFPAASIINLTITNKGVHSDYRPDLISCGIITLKAAEQYFAFYQQNLDPCIHHILAESDSLAIVRARSSPLTAAICAVASFCTCSKDYQKCLKVFMSEVSEKMFCDQYTFDDVRALCIGAFWLNEVSSALNGLSVRIATELDLHRCITKMPHGKRACYDRTRLFFLVYLCDHHCSLTHGRPPMTREMRSLKIPRAFLQTEFSNPTDLNLISQVELWSINRDVFDLFGADIENSIVSDRSVELARLSMAYDRWHEYWRGLLALKDEPDSFFQHVFDLYFHASKLCLFSHAFRGLPQGDAKSSTESDAIGNYAQWALDSALSVVRCAVDGNGARPWLGRLPVYFRTMIAFASVCLLKTSLQGQTSSDTETNEIRGCLHQLVEVLCASSMADSPTQPLMSIAKSLQIATGERYISQGENFFGNSDSNLDNLSFDFDLDLFANDNLNLSFLENTDD